ncbi:phosphatidylserine decarboxylase [Aspergillus tanneri]|nr:uncharacterized protein ATNIH1004_002905 [Aspergillus tanneri]KAA8650224.1 hypothetical protein ATNIH1004_002905 [Aspergillus tanneri]
MAAEKIGTLEDYLRFVDSLLRWVPKVSSEQDELLRKILVFNWVFEQPSLRDLQTPIKPENSNDDLTWLSYWLVTFAREQGNFMNRPESMGSVYSFHINSKYDKEKSLWAEPESGWLSFNHWFAREWKDINQARPLDRERDSNIIVHAADSLYDGNWDIVDGIVNIPEPSIRTKGIRYPIQKLLQTVDSDVYKNGSFMHAFLAPNDYHCQHAPVSGKVIKIKNIQDQAYLQVRKKKGQNGLTLDRGLIRDPDEIKRRQDQRKRQNLGDIDARIMRGINGVKFAGSSRSRHQNMGESQSCLLEWLKFPPWLSR